MCVVMAAGGNFTKEDIIGLARHPSYYLAVRRLRNRRRRSLGESQSMPQAGRQTERQAGRQVNTVMKAYMRKDCCRGRVVAAWREREAYEGWRQAYITDEGDQGQREGEDVTSPVFLLVLILLYVAVLGSISDRC